MRSTTDGSGHSLTLKKSAARVVKAKWSSGPQQREPESGQNFGGAALSRAVTRHCEPNGGKGENFRPGILPLDSGHVPGASFFFQAIFQILGLTLILCASRTSYDRSRGKGGLVASCSFQAEEEGGAFN